ncbi:MAG: glycosyltransferase family A protein [bacterium]|nr:glycosyltransferase family A protein [bacterium]
MSPRPLVSLVITTKNEAKNIDHCLASIAAQTYQPIETIVVDNQSTDDTKERARKYTDLVFDKGPERSAQRNYGLLEKSQGELLMFIDADMILASNLIEEAVKLMLEGGHVALHLPEIVLGKNFFSQVRRFERRFYDGTVIDGARFFSKEKLAEIGGFDESMSGPEDWDLDKKFKQIGSIGLLLAPSAAQSPEIKTLLLERGVDPADYGAVVYHNEAEFDLTAYLKKKGYYAQSFDGYIQKWGADDPDIRRQFSPAYRFCGVFIEHGKWLRLAAHPFLSLGMYFLRFMVGLKFLTRKR